MAVMQSPTVSGQRMAEEACSRLIPRHIVLSRCGFDQRNSIAELTTYVHDVSIGIPSSKTCKLNKWCGCGVLIK